MGCSTLKKYYAQLHFYKEGSPWGRRENVGLILHGKYVF
jgi:hypothetical protein